MESYEEIKTNFIARFSKLLEESGYTYEELGKKIGVSKTTISYYKKGTNIPNGRNINLLAKVFNVSPAYLAGFDVPKYEKIDGEVDIDLDDIVYIPHYGSVQAGFNHCPEHFDGEKIPVFAEQIKGYQKRDVFALTVRGSSMYPRMEEGDLVLVNSNLLVENGQIGIFEYDDTTTIKEFYRDNKNKTITLKPYNPEHPTTTFTFAEAEEVRLRCIGRVVELLKRKF